ncbi:MAG: hypothetical protein AB8H80_11855 [Planctomycetota bacterium]
MLATESLWTNAAAAGGAEGVRVRFDTARIGFEKLLARATSKKCDVFVLTTTEAQQAAAKKVVGARAKRFASVLAAGAPRRDKEQQYYLHKSALRYVPMTAAQATRVNAAKRSGGDGFRAYLSPHQLEWLRWIEGEPKAPWPVAQGVPLAAAVQALRRVRAKR